jgi:RNA-directed DNA polymerase
MVGSGQPREGTEPQSVVPYSEESDEGMVPKKSAKTRVTPVESMEERPAAKGKFASGNALRAQDRQGALTQEMRIGQRAREKKGERFVNLLILEPCKGAVDHNRGHIWVLFGTPFLEPVATENVQA